MSVIGTSSGSGRARAGDDDESTYKGIMVGGVVFLLISVILVCYRLYSWYGIIVVKLGGS